MSDEEFDVLDELYFVTSFHDLKENIGWSIDILVPVLKQLYEKGLIRILHDVDDEVPDEQVSLLTEFSMYHYLASKKGLLEHNSK
jgi:DNA-binding MarR family transcriptional regulator